MELLITKDEIIGFALANKSFDKALIKDSVIEAVQESYFRPLIGDDLFDEIMGQTTLTELNKTLVDQYKPVLAYNVMLLCIPTVMMNITSSGIQINNSEFAQSGTDKQRADVAESTREIGRMLKEKFLRWLKKNKDDYPLFVEFVYYISNDCRNETWWDNSLKYFFDDLESSGNNASVIGGIIL